MRSHYCGQVNESLNGTEVTVAGWVHRRRDHGGVIFVDLRDREGLLQVVFDPDRQEMFTNAERLRSEFCIKVKGRVRARPFHLGGRELVWVDFPVATIPDTGREIQNRSGPSNHAPMPATAP